MNTLENKAKFFAQYWGQKIFNQLGKITKVDSWSIDHENFKFCFLELKPLSNISDKDAIDIFNHLYPNHLPTDDLEKIDVIKGVFENDFRPHKFLDLNESTRFIDKSRSLGYVLDWNGITVEQQIEYNWIKLKES